jgi:hypothetical protein
MKLMNKYCFIIKLILPIICYSQKHYLVEYDRINNDENYFELKYDKGELNQNPIKKPYLEKRDVVKFRVVNYNPFVFKKLIVADGKKKTKENFVSKEIFKNLKPVLDINNNLLGSIANEISNLSTSELTSLEVLNGKMRGNISETEQKKINSLKKLSSFHESILNAYKALEQYEKSINCIYSTTLNKKQIIDELTSSISKFDVSAYNNQIRNLKKDFINIASDPLLKKEEIKEDVESFKKLTIHLDSLIESPKNANELLLEVENQKFSSEFTKIIGLKEYNNEFFDLKGDEQIYLMEFRSNTNDANDQLGVSSNQNYNNLLQGHDVNLPVKQQGSFNWSTGIVAIWAFNGFKNYETKIIPQNYPYTDSIKIISKSWPSSRIAIGTNLLYNIPVKGSVVPQVLFGTSISINTPDNDYGGRYNKPINFLLGSGIKFKKFPFLSLSGGFTFCEGVKLKQGYEEGGTYFSEDLGFEYTQTTFLNGYFLGLNLNF